MNRKLIALSAGSLGLLTSLASGPLCAQQSEQQASEITVVAPRAVTREVVGRAAPGRPIELISLTRHVGYADLNLAVEAGVTQLEQRINDVARQSCDQLEKMYPLSDQKTPDCIREAVASAKAEKDAAVNAARTKRP
jgi:UrcA family protein